MAEQPATTAIADLNLVLAEIKEKDELKSRAQKYLRAQRTRPRVTLAVGIELLFWCRKHEANYVEHVGAAVHAFDVEQADVLLSAAHALQHEGLRSPFDAVHLAQAMVEHATLVTADEALWKTKYPTQRY